MTPFGRFGGTNYRPDGTPTKVGLWLSMVRLACMIYLPGNKMSYDEGTAKYTGKMTRMKHRQSRYKPYDGIRIYMLNDSRTGLCCLINVCLLVFICIHHYLVLQTFTLYSAGYVANFRVDTRDGSTIAEMMKYVNDEFNVPGIEVYADNLFVSVDMLRWCRANGVNLCGTTRRTFGYPDDLARPNKRGVCVHDVLTILLCSRN